LVNGIGSRSLITPKSRVQGQGNTAPAHPDKVAGIIGIFPAYDFRTYPKVATAAAAYGMTPEELQQRISSCKIRN
jgi:hypothetical protein